MLSIVHGSNVPAGVFGDEAERGGHEVDTWSLAWGTPPPGPIDDYGAVMIFGGAMHADQDDRHPWLREENFFIQRLLDLHIPVLGVCLGAQLIAKAADAEVPAMSEPEVGWVDVELTDEAADDPLFAGLPSRFPASSGTTTSSRRRAAPRCSRAATGAPRPTAWATRLGRAVPPGGHARDPRGWFPGEPDEFPAPRNRCSPSSNGKPTAGRRSGERSAATSSRPQSGSADTRLTLTGSSRGASTRATTPRNY